jgi:capsular exopolysaccharide synthesis family protein
MNSSAQPAVVSDTPRKSGLPDIVDVAFKSRWWILAGTSVGFGLGMLAYLYAGPSYETKAKILVSKRGHIEIKEDGPGARTYGERGEHVTLIMSPLIVGEAIRDFGLDKLPSLAASTDPTEDIVESVKARRTAGSDLSFINVIELAYETPARREGPKVVEGLVKTYEKYLKKSQSESTTEAVSQVDARSRDLERQLRDAETRQQDQRAKAPLHWRNAPGTEGQSGDTTNIHQERVLALEQARREKLIRRTEVSTKLAAIEKGIADKVPPESLELLVRRYMAQDGNNLATQQDPADSKAYIDPRTALLESRLAPLMLEEQRLMRDYGFGPDHPQVKVVKNSMQLVRDFFHEQGVSFPDEPGGKLEPKRVDLPALYAASLRQELDEIAMRDREMLALVESETKAAKAFAVFQLEDHRLSNEIKRLNDLWQAVKTSLASVDLLRDNAGFSLKIVSPPNEERSLKKPIKIIGAFTALGAMLTGGLAYFRAVRDTRIRSVDALQEALGWRVVGRLVKGGKQRLALRHEAISPSLVFFHNPNCPESEAYRGLRSALFVLTRHMGKRVVQVTSPEMSDGKTTLATNLAIAIAQSGKRVLLVDADLRRPRVHTLLALRADGGLAEVLSGELLVENAVQPTQMPNLFAISTGRPPENPSELLSSPKLSEIFARLGASFDFVLVDTPPVSAVSDPCIVAQHVDGVLLVVRIGKNRLKVVEHTRDLLLDHGAIPLGVVANGVDEPEGYGEYGGYGSKKAPYVPDDLGATPVPRPTRTFDTSSADPTPEEALAAATGSITIGPTLRTVVGEPRPGGLASRV